MPIKMYTELDITFLRLNIPNVGMLIAEELNQVLDQKYQTKLPGIVGWNLIWLSYNMFVKKYGTKGFDLFMCSEGVNPLLFSQLCVFHYSDVWKNNTLGTTSGVMSQHIKISKSLETDDLSKKDRLNFRGKDGAKGQVTIGSKQNPICVPGNLAITVPGQTSKISSKVTCLVEQAQHHILPLGIVIKQVCGHNKDKEYAYHSGKYHQTECVDSATLAGC